MSLADDLATVFKTTDNDAYKSAIERALWSLDEASALIAGLVPENYKNGSKGYMNISDEEFMKRNNYASTIFSQMLDDIDEKGTLAKFIPHDNRIFLSPWKYVKWIAENNIEINKRFFTALPLSLMELYYEFQPINTALRTASKHSRDYHQALYLQHAKKLMEELPEINISEIYRHSHMKNIERYIRELGGKYKQRTLLESWLPKIKKSVIGRPKKHKKVTSENTVTR